MNITMTRNEIKELLGATDERLKYLIKKDSLANELKIFGYELISQEKIGRNIMYDVNIIEADEWGQYQSNKKIIKKEEHTTYVENRLSKDGLTSSRRNLLKSINSDISESTASRYDHMLLEDYAMQKDKTVYLLFNPTDEVFTEITEDEYRMFWKDSMECKYQLGHNKMRYNKGLIPESTYESNNFIFMNALGKEKGEVALKFDTYKEYTNTLNIIAMIKKHRKINRGNPSKLYNTV